MSLRHSLDCRATYVCCDLSPLSSAGAFSTVVPLDMKSKIKTACRR